MSPSKMYTEPKFTYFVWESRNAKKSAMELVNEQMVPIWKKTEIRIDFFGIDVIRVELTIDDELGGKPLSNQVRISANLSVESQNENISLRAPLTAAMMKKLTGTLTDSLSLEPAEGCNFKTVSFVLVPFWRTSAERMADLRNLKFKIFRENGIIEEFDYKYRVYSPHSGTRSKLLKFPHMDPSCNSLSDKDSNSLHAQENNLLFSHPTNTTTATTLKTLKIDPLSENSTISEQKNTLPSFNSILNDEEFEIVTLQKLNDIIGNLKKETVYIEVKVGNTTKKYAFNQPRINANPLDLQRIVN